MKRFQPKNYRAQMVVAAFSILWMMTGCATVGPSSLSSGRANYNEAINKTEDEQMLSSIVKGRYGETFSLLSVSGVAANVRFKTSAGIEAGFGPEKYYLENLVPFTGSVAYEENPTITYKPVAGEQYIRQLLSPISLNLMVLILRSETNSSAYLNLFVNRINDLQNPDFKVNTNIDNTAEFQRLTELSQILSDAGIIQWVEGNQKEIPFEILISGHAPAYTEKVSEFLTLLGLPVSGNDTEDIVIPVLFAVKGGKTSGIAISTRSTYDLIEILRAAVDIPPEHMASGFARSYPEVGIAGEHIRIFSSKSKPQAQTIAIKYRGYWFYIDEADMQTKLFYDMVRTLWSVSISAAADLKSAPVLTIPVSR